MKKFKKKEFDFGSFVYRSRMLGFHLREAGSIPARATMKIVNREVVFDNGKPLSPQQRRLLVLKLATTPHEDITIKCENESLRLKASS